MYNLQYLSFREININDTFFDSLKADYVDFEKWYAKKIENHEGAYVQYDDNNQLQGFLYLKLEESGVINDVTPHIIGNRILKVGTFKIIPHGTRMGEQFLKVLLDYAIDNQIDVCYLTIYEKHSALINLICKYGFIERGIKASTGEKVYVKNIRSATGDCFFDYPMVSTKNNRKYMLSIYPKYHSKMFPESILTNENRSIIKDISYTNSIQKKYVCSMDGVDKLSSGDIVVMYRTAESGRAAEYTAVATTVCTVTGMRSQNSFEDFNDLYSYVNKYTAYERDDLEYWFKRGRIKVIDLIYNFSLRNRIVRHELIERLGLKRDEYWGFFELTDKNFIDIINYGHAERYIT